MRIRQIPISDIIDFLGDAVRRVYGVYSDRFIDNLADAGHVISSTLDWINPAKAEKQALVEGSVADVILVDDTINYSRQLQENGKVLICVDNPKLALAKIGNHFFSDNHSATIHPTSIIDPDAQLGSNVAVGPYCYIGKCHIGDNTIIESNVRVYDDVKIGQNCRIKPGAIIGGEGFGFVRDESNNLLRFPQIGDIEIGNYVEIGANTCIDRGALSTTKIGDYTKINNLCHIAHNNIIGRNVVIAALVNVSGGNVIEDNVWIAPASSIRGYIHIGMGSTVGMGAVVVKDIPESETWVGNPAKKLR